VSGDRCTPLHGLIVIAGLSGIDAAAGEATLLCLDAALWRAKLPRPLS
jgi:hypothetical protein